MCRVVILGKAAGLLGGGLPLFMTSYNREEGGLVRYEVTCWIQASPSPHLSPYAHPSLLLPFCHALSLTFTEL